MNILGFKFDEEKLFIAFVSMVVGMLIGACLGISIYFLGVHP